MFAAFLAVHADALFTVPDGHATTEDILVQNTGRMVRLTAPPELILFAEKMPIHRHGRKGLR